jgi:hypothetical protein
VRRKLFLPLITRYSQWWLRAADGLLYRPIYPCDEDQLVPDVSR